MTYRDEFEHITKEAYVAIFKATGPIFDGLLREVRELSKKKPEATMSGGKVKMINRVLEDLLIILKDQPTGKYLDRLDDATLPQMSDALLTMVQFNTALDAFKAMHLKRVGGSYHWITEEILNDWDDAESEIEIDDDDD
tara:strand:- start:1148 stop:1564 length:417 start_codon:yes stop_codon:yes gene_type:complete